MSCDPSRICRHCSMFACGEATDPSEMCREAILERLATAEAASRPVFSRRLLEHRLAAAEARVRALEAGIKAAMDCSGNRWSEWGERAENVADMLDALLAPPPEAEKKGGE